MPPQEPSAPDGPANDSPARNGPAHNDAVQNGATHNDAAVPPGLPHMVPPASSSAGPSPAGPSMVGPSPAFAGPPTGPLPQYYAQPLPQPPSNAPSPLGLGIAGVGFALLCVSLLLPRIKLDDPDGEFSFYSVPGSFGTGGGFGIDMPTVILALALLAAVVLSTSRNPALRWPVRLAAIGAAGLTAAVAYHPVTQVRQSIAYYESYDEFGADGAGTAAITATADSGVYIIAVAAALLALSTFFMHLRRQQQYAPPPPVAGGRPGVEPTVTVTPG